MDNQLLSVKRENFRVEIRKKQVDEFLKSKRVIGYLEVSDQQTIQDQVNLVYQNEKLNYQHLNFLVRFHQEQPQDINSIIQIIYFYNALLSVCNTNCVEELVEKFEVIDFLIQKLYNVQEYHSRLFLGIVDTLLIISQKVLQFQFEILQKLTQALSVNIGKLEITDDEFYLLVLEFLFFNYKSRIAFSQIKESIELLNKISKYYAKSNALFQQQPLMALEDTQIDKRKEDILLLIVSCLKYYLDKSFNRYDFTQDKGIFILIKKICDEQFSQKVLLVLLNTLQVYIMNNKKAIMAIQEKIDLISLFGNNLNLNQTQEPQKVKIRIHCLYGITALFESDLNLIDHLKETKMYDLLIQLCKEELNYAALQKELFVIRKFMKNDKYTTELIPLAARLFAEQIKDIDLNKRQVMLECMRILNFFLKKGDEKYLQIMKDLEVKSLLQHVLLNVKSQASQQKAKTMLVYFDID